MEKRLTANVSDPVATLPHGGTAAGRRAAVCARGAPARSQQTRTPARPHRRTADGGRRPRCGGAAGAQPVVRAAVDRPAQPQRHARHRRHLRGHRADGPVVAVGGQDAPLHGAAAPAPTIAQLARTTATWAIPLAVAPPLFSRDVYSYLAQSAELARGIDPYVLGPAGRWASTTRWSRSIPTIWRDTPAPYGPLFLVLGRGITALTGDDVVLGIFAYRVLALCGLALIIWALPRLARRCGVDGGLALWLGVGNPLVLFHLVSGIHNEALMIGLFLAGMEIGLRAGDPRTRSAPARRRLPDRLRLGRQAARAARAGLPRPALGAASAAGESGTSPSPPRCSPRSRWRSTRRCRSAPASGSAGPRRSTCPR